MEIIPAFENKSELPVIFWFSSVSDTLGIDTEMIPHPCPPPPPFSHGQDNESSTTRSSGIN